MPFGYDSAFDVTSLTTLTANESGANSFDITATPQIFSRSRASNGHLKAIGNGVPGLIGTSRSASASYVLRYAGNSATVSEASQAPTTRNVIIFDRTISGTTVPSRIAFYSIGESLNLALLDARVTALINAFSTAIP